MITGLGYLSLRNFDGNLDRGIVSRNIGQVFITQALEGVCHILTLAISGLVSHQRVDEIIHFLPSEIGHIRMPTIANEANRISALITNCFNCPAFRNG